MKDRIFCHFGPFFALSHPLLTTQKIKILEKWKKLAGDIIILCRCTINDIWCKVPEIWSVSDKFLSFWTILCPFTPLTTWKIKILKNWKIIQISSFYNGVPKIMIICYTVPEILHITDVTVIFHFGLSFALLLP